MIAKKTFVYFQFASLFLNLDAFTLNFPKRSSRRSTSSRFVEVPNKDDIVDVDFERVANSAVKEGNRSDDIEEGSLLDERKKTLIDVSLESGDPAWKELRIPFCKGDEYIDAKLAFTVDIEGVTYGIAVPFDPAVAVVAEDFVNNKIQYIDPENYDEDEDGQELMEIMAAQVQKQLGEELALRKTPKVLTISGGLEKITANWEEKLMPKPVSPEALLEGFDEDMDKEIQNFYDFMKEELGEEEFEKTMNEDISPEDEKLLELFDIPGLGTQKDDIEGIEELVASIQDDMNGASLPDEFGLNFDQSALKLISYNWGDGSKAYSLVKFLDPPLLIGRFSPQEKDIRFELLTENEEKIILPTMEKICEKDFKDAGLDMPSSRAKRNKP